MNRLKLAAFVLLTVSAMAWLAAICQAAPPSAAVAVEHAFVQARKAAQPSLPDSLSRSGITPQPLGNHSETPDSSPREVVLIVPDFPCGACQWLEGQLATIPGIKVRKQVDMTRPSWPWLSVPDTGHEWGYYHPVTKQPLTAANVAAILKQFPPVEKPAKRGAK